VTFILNLVSLVVNLQTQIKSTIFIWLWPC